MKEKLLRVIGSICIIASLLVMFLPGIIKIDGLPKKEIREGRKLILSDVEIIRNYFSTNLKYIEDDLEDNDLPNTRSEVREYFDELENFVKVVINDNISLKNVIVCAAKVPEFLSDGEKMLETDCFAEAIPLVENFSEEDFETTIDSLSPLNIVFILLIVFFGIIILSGLVAAVGNIFNKLGFVKYIFLAFLVLITTLLIVCLPMVSDAIADAGLLFDGTEKFSIGMTVFPYIAIAFLVVAIIIDIVLVVKGKKKMPAEEPTAEEQIPLTTEI